MINGILTKLTMSNGHQIYKGNQTDWLQSLERLIEITKFPHKHKPTDNKAQQIIPIEAIETSFDILTSIL